MATLSVKSISKRFGDVIALDDVSVTFQSQRITAVIGRSGCGKSSLLKMCNGLDRPDHGSVELFEQSLDYSQLPTLRRRIGYALQGSGLFPHLTAGDNITLLARIEKWSDNDIDQRLDQLLSLMQIQTPQLLQYPHQLSGGQQQRVALCRAMMLRPELLLLDEPFAAIDPLTRMDIHQQLLALHHSEPTTTVLVTHDMNEALLLAEDIVIMDAGKIVINASKEQLLAEHPDTDPNTMLLSLMSRAEI